MKLRNVVIFTGKRFKVPQCIQRIDHRATHGWQLRYGGTKMFSDFTPDGRGAREALAKATSELLARIARLPAPTKLLLRPSAGKASGLPVGVYGPVVRQRAGSQFRDCSFSVSVPRFGDAPTRRSVYIGTEVTYTPERRQLALAKAIKLRELAEQAYRSAATKARRAEARAHGSAR